MYKLIWHAKNALPKIQYHLRKKKSLSPEAEIIYEKMLREGYAVESTDIHEIRKESDNILAANPGYKNHIENKVPVGTGKAKEWIYAFDLPPDGPMMRFAKSDFLKTLAEKYLGMDPVLTEAHLSVTIPTDELKGSNIWHRDRGDFMYFRAFIYIDDIGASTGGELGYVPKSHSRGVYKKYFKNKGALGVRIKDENMKLSSLQMYGNAGTIVFCDTSGIHKNSISSKPVRKILIVYATQAHSRNKEYQELTKTQK